MILNEDEFYAALPVGSAYAGKSINEICNTIIEEKSSIGEIAFNSGARLIGGELIFSVTAIETYTYILMQLHVTLYMP